MNTPIIDDYLSSTRIIEKQIIATPEHEFARRFDGYGNEMYLLIERDGVPIWTDYDELVVFIIDADLRLELFRKLIRNKKNDTRKKQ
jgi:hypothetical protein